MALIGEMPTFWNGSSDWSIYTEKLANFLLLNDITNEPRKTAILISSICEESYDILRNLCYPMKPNEKSYNQLIQLLKIVDKCTNNSNDNDGVTVYRKRYEFYLAKQMENETILQWLEKIQLLSQNCQFKHNYSSIVADRFFCGLYSSNIVEKICQQYGTLKLWQLAEMAIACEKNDQKETSIVETSLEKLTV